MPIDEFGREIPAVGGGPAVPGGIGGSHPTNPFVDPRHGDHHPRDADRAHQNNRNRHRPRSRSRDDRDRADPPDADPPARRPRGGSGGGGGERRSRSPPAVPSSPGGAGRAAAPGSDASPDREGGRDRDRDGGGRDRPREGGGRDGRRRGGGGRRRGRARADSSADDRGARRGGDRGGDRGGGGGRRRGRSRSYGDGDDGRGGHRGGGGGGSSRRGSSGPGGRAKAHASERYSDQPMLSQFLWKKELEEARAKGSKRKGSEEDAGGREGGDAPTGDGGDKDGDGDADMKEDDAAPGGETGKPPPLFETAAAETSAYSDYNTKYCLNYVRTFFNHHLDDPWFRARLSPLETYRGAKRERARATAEAAECRKEILQSLEDASSGVIPKKDPDCAEYLGPPKCNFVASCRLGVGTKPTAHAPHHAPHHHAYGGPHHDPHPPRENETHMQHSVLQGEDRNRIERHAKSHLLSFIKSESCVKLMDVPSNVSDAQLLSTMAEYCGTAKEAGREPPIAVWSDAVCVPVHDAASMDPYHRTAFAVFPSTAAKDAMLEGLHKANEEANRRDDRRRRKGETLPRVLDLDVDCTDVYGRTEVDADGKGGPPPNTGKKKDVDTKLPAKRCTVFVSTSLLASSQPVSVLSAAVSSRERISRDKEDACTIAGTLDEVRQVEMGSRHSDLLHLLYPGNELRSVDDEDILDISIAYLRRVHLFSFYNGCAATPDVGNVLSFSHPAGTIHLRLRDADEILAKSAEEKSNGGAAVVAENGAEEDKEDAGGSAEETKTDVAKDMLVTRLNDSIAKALENSKAQAENGPACLVDIETDAIAHSIDVGEQTSREDWIENHGIHDEDGRARCSFHFCRKLFKDKAFLHKHLIKKHSDQLRSECAKCHDGPMMAAWDGDVRRPVPPVLMDCGSKFGLVPSAVDGSDGPSADDPEPELWKEERGRMEEEERRHRERDAAARAAEEETQRRREVANAGEKRKSNFVDPDDMVEEKVELSFVEVVAPPPKKKKKKKKSLL